MLDEYASDLLTSSLQYLFLVCCNKFGPRRLLVLSLMAISDLLQKLYYYNIMTVSDLDVFKQQIR